MPRSTMDKGDRSALSAVIETVVADLLRTKRRATSARVAEIVEERAPELIERLFRPLAHNQLVKMARDVLKRTTDDESVERDGRQARFEGFDTIEPLVRQLLPRTIAVPRALAEELMGDLESDDAGAEEGDGAGIGRPPIEFVSLGYESDEELDAAIEYLQQRIAFDQRRVQALIDYRRWRRTRHKGA